MFERNRITFAIALFVGLSGATLSAAVTAAVVDQAAMVNAKEVASTVAKRGRGKDDAAGDDHGTHGAGHPKSEEVVDLARRGRGKDDAAGDDHGTHGAGHPKSEEVLELARRGRGADDGAAGGRREDRRADRRQA